jgi:hypothetical protein
VYAGAFLWYRGTDALGEAWQVVSRAKGNASDLAASIGGLAVSAAAIWFILRALGNAVGNPLRRGAGILTVWIKGRDLG